MKTKNTLAYKALAIVLICSAAFFSACKKGSSEGPYKPYIYHPTTLMALWSAQPHVDGVDNLIGFNTDSTFIISISNYNAGSASTNWATGKFRVKGDSLSLTVTQRKTSVNNGAVTVTDVNEKIYNKATYVVKNDQLIISYITIKDGTPVASTAVFNYLPLAL
ncbi:hypothetical protein IDJ77_12245 [Mucilaginibacter sp. ZT4R22]|uniref:Lipid-binding hydrolase n=1 Tax=Mucilaginibacter pankratovii TaxID=2772110 RepID=A0ABR7WQT7_9SPHI|nr:hypothetical protein [Mucilaginibacter pankratovii]MBD1364581.1 hypothetical protein [Mucilaginibacter pankratovii]